MPLQSMTNGALLAHVLRSAPKALERLSGPLGESARAAIARHETRPSDEKREIVSSLVREFGDVARVPVGSVTRPVTLLLAHDDERAGDEARRLDTALEPDRTLKARP